VYAYTVPPNPFSRSYASLVNRELDRISALVCVYPEWESTVSMGNSKSVTDTSEDSENIQSDLDGAMSPKQRPKKRKDKGSKGYMFGKASGSDRNRSQNHGKPA
jgi:hypothetical protein